MKATELRIGNLLYYLNLVIFVCEIDKRLLSFDSGIKLQCGRLDEFKPIPLTEEWLLKFGFNRRDAYFGFCRKKYNQEGRWKYLILNRRSGIFYAYRYGYGNFCKLQYVHQLQNLYFSLTNEDLTIK